MRIVTRPDFDGVVCAVLLKDALKIDSPVFWVEPSEVQKNQVAVTPQDVLANLPYAAGCALWFDHHYSNQIDTPFEGAFAILPSAARVIYDHYQGQFSRDYDALVAAADKIDAADLTPHEVEQPEAYPEILLSMTIIGQNEADAVYWNHLVDLLTRQSIAQVLRDPEVADRGRQVVEQNQIYRELLLTHTRMQQHVSLTDFRLLNPAPSGNRFLVYSLFPESVVNLKIRHDPKDRQKMIISVGHSIFNRNCQVNVGQMLARFEGGGHAGAGACRFQAEKTERYLAEILSILLANQPLEKEE